SGGGGVVAGSAAEALSVSNATVRTDAGADGGLHVLAGTVDIGARHESAYGAVSDSTQASVAGGSGAYAGENVISNVHVTIGTARKSWLSTPTWPLSATWRGGTSVPSTRRRAASSTGRPRTLKGTSSRIPTSPWAMACASASSVRG